MTISPAGNIGRFSVSGRTVRIETFEQLINFGAGRQFTFSKATKAKPENVTCNTKTILQT
jgi:hypothetical protein